MKIEEGKSYHISIRGYIEVRKIHIMYILDSVYEGERLIVYRYFGKYHRWWHGKMEREDRLIREINGLKEFKKRNYGTKRI